MTDNKTPLSGHHVIVFAGPNGSGKTSLINEVQNTGLQTVRGVYPVPAYVINPDQIAKDLKGVFPDQDSRDRAAFEASIKIRSTVIEMRTSDFDPNRK